MDFGAMERSGVDWLKLTIIGGFDILKHEEISDERLFYNHVTCHC